MTFQTSKPLTWNTVWSLTFIQMIYRLSNFNTSCICELYTKTHSSYCLFRSSIWAEASVVTYAVVYAAARIVPMRFNANFFDVEAPFLHQAFEEHRAWRSAKTSKTCLGLFPISEQFFMHCHITQTSLTCVSCHMYKTNACFTYRGDPNNVWNLQPRHWKYFRMFVFVNWCRTTNGFNSLETVAWSVENTETASKPEQTIRQCASCAWLKRRRRWLKPHRHLEHVKSTRSFPSVRLYVWPTACAWRT